MIVDRRLAGGDEAVCGGGGDGIGIGQHDELARHPASSAGRAAARKMAAARTAAS